MVDIHGAIERLKNREPLKEDEIETLFDGMLDGSVDSEDMAEFLVLLAEKGEEAHEIAAAVRALKSHADTLDTGMELLDTCGTGGDGKASFNISTAAAIVCSLFVPVAKHGNRAVSSKSGSADVLEALGIKIDMKKEEAYSFLKKTNFTFLFAPHYHPAMKHVAPVRKRLGIRTIFNLIGPLSNPFNPAFQVIGVFSEAFLEPMFEATGILGMDNVILVSSRDGMDEVSLSDITICYQRKGLFEGKSVFDPLSFGIAAPGSSVRGYDAGRNAQIMEEMFRLRNEHEDLKNAVCINAAFGLLAASVESDLKAAFLLAKESIESGRAYEKLQELRNESFS